MFCAKCGHELAPSANHCSDCGEKVTGVENIDIKEGFHAATRGTRFLNLIIDSICLVLIEMIISATVSDSSSGYAMVAGTFIIFLPVIFYLICENIWQKTPGKFLTKTKVVSFDGKKAELKNIIGRSFARLIPFDHLSFLGNKFPIGWHDKLSKTLVVSDKYSEGDIVRIEKKQKNTFVIIIVILGGIIITGILSTLVVVALGNARIKARDAKRVADTRQVMSALALYYNDAGSYPSQIIPGKPIKYKGTIYMQEMPSNPTPRNDGDCPDQEYSYTGSSDNQTFSIDYCLGRGVGDLMAGKHKATADGLDQ